MIPAPDRAPGASAPTGPRKPKSLFDDLERDDLGLAGRIEPTFQYLNRSSRPVITRVREVMENWFSHLPRDAQARMRGALLKPKDHRQEQAAFWELYVHESLRRAGWAVEPHGGTPDFVVQTPVERLHVEATSASTSDEDVAAEHRLAQFLDALDRTKTGRWRLSVEVAPGPSPLSGRKVRRRVECWLATLGFDEAFCGRARYEAWPSWQLEFDGWDVRVRAVPHGSPRAPDRGAIWSSGTSEMLLVENDDAVRASVASKLDQCAHVGGAPLIVALALSRDYASDHQIESALYGTEGVEIGFDPNRLAMLGLRPFRAGNGLWSRDGVRATRLRALLTTTRLSPFSIARVRPRIWVNPWRLRSPLDLPEQLPWTQHWVDEDGRGHEVEQGDPAEFFGLPPDWPGDD